jgi:serine/threonine protein kinase
MPGISEDLKVVAHLRGFHGMSEMTNESGSSETHSTRLPNIPNTPNIQIERYKVLELLGQGGMGIILKARHTQLDKLVAIKVLSASLLVDDTSVKRFEQEARAGSQLTHPNLINVFDYGVTPEREPYLVMEFVDGESLQEVLSRQLRLSISEFLLVFEQVARGLQYIHKHGIVHRDLKPGNIMLQRIDGELYAKLLDFGIAKIIDGTGLSLQKLTETGSVLGSPLYMSPEQCKGEEIDARSDIYSLGCVMYESLAGTAPIMGDNSLQTIFKQVNSEAPPLVLDPDSCAGEVISALVNQCLIKEPSLRLQSAQDLLKGLAKVKEAIDLEKYGSGKRAVVNSPVSYGKDDKTMLVKSAELQAQGGFEKPSVASRANIEAANSPRTLPSPQPSSLPPSLVRSHSLEQSVPSDLPFARWLVPTVAGLCLVAGLFFLSRLGLGSKALDAGGYFAMAQRSFAQGESHWVDARPQFLAVLGAPGLNSSMAGRSHSRLGVIYLSEGNQQKAKEHFSKALTLLNKKQVEEQQEYLRSLYGEAQICRRQSDWSQADLKLKEARGFASQWQVEPELGGDILVASAQSEILQSKNAREAMAYFDQALIQYLKETKTVTKAARTWLLSAQFAQKMHWLDEAQRRANSAIYTAAKIEPAASREEIIGPAELLVRGQAPRNVVQSLSASATSAPTSIPGGNSDLLTTEQNLKRTQLQLEQFKQSQAAVQEIGRLQNQNFAAVTENLRRQSQAVSGSADSSFSGGASRTSGNSASSQSNLEKVSDFFVPK